MLHPSDALASSGAQTPAALAAQLEGVTDKLSGWLGAPALAGLDQEFQECTEALRRISAALRGLALLFDPGRAHELAQREEELKAIVATIGDGIRELAHANRAIAEKVGDEIHELDAIADLPPGEELAARLRRAVARLRDAAREMARRIETMSDDLDHARRRVAVLEAQVDEARRLALHDALTRVHSRVALEQRLALMTATGAGNGPWCVLLLDIDGFKAINDRYGHLVGDALLFKLARVVEDALQGRTREGLLARYGGEEFVVVLPSAPLAEACDVAEHLRTVVASSRWQCRGVASEPVLTATVSIGVAQFRPGDTSVSLLHRADEALYRAKRDGRDRVCVEEA